MRKKSQICVERHGLAFSLRIIGGMSFDQFILFLILRSFNVPTKSIPSFLRPEDYHTGIIQTDRHGLLGLEFIDDQ